MKWSLVLITACLFASQGYTQNLSITVYTDNLAVVRDETEMDFTKGRQIVTRTDVAEQIDPTSVRLKPLKGELTIHEQNFRYDLVSSQKVLEQCIDKRIMVWVENGELIEGILQSVSGDVVIRTDDGGITIVKLDSIQRYQFDQLPEGFVTRPTLFWDLTSGSAGKNAVEISYMTGGFDWHAEYSAVVSSDEKNMELSSWVSIQNQSGTTYKNAALKLMAGAVNRVQPQYAPRAMSLSMESIQQAAPSGFEERALYEYHVYELQGRTTIQNNEIKQIALFEPATAAVKQMLVFDPQVDPNNVTAKIEFVNSKSAGLGMPLPAGVVRVYTRDTDGALEFVGEDRIDHTPVDETVRLTTGSAFDIAAERRVMETNRISTQIQENTIEIELRNRKTEPVTITAVEHFRGDWNITQTSDPFTRKNVSTAECAVTIPAGSVKTIRFTVRQEGSAIVYPGY